MLTDSDSGYFQLFYVTNLFFVSIFIEENALLCN